MHPEPDAGTSNAPEPPLAVPSLPTESMDRLTVKAELLYQAPVPVPVPFHYHFSAGLNNQLFAFQKVVCLLAAFNFHACIVQQPLGSSHDLEYNTWNDLVRLNKLSTYLVQSRRAADLHCPSSQSSMSHACIQTNAKTQLAAVSLASLVRRGRCVNLTGAYYAPDTCLHGAEQLPDLSGVTHTVRSYADRVLRKMCVEVGSLTVVQYRFGPDWTAHDAVFRGSCISLLDIQRQVSHNATVVVMSPGQSVEQKRVMDSACNCPRATPPRWRGFCHDARSSHTLRVLSELYIASQAKHVYLNPQSTFRHFIRRMRPANEPVHFLRPLSSLKCEGAKPLPE